MTDKKRRAAVRRGWLLAGLLGGAMAGAAWADLPNERQTVAQMPKDTANRVYLSDPAMGHLVDGRMHVVDAPGKRYLGMVGTGFAGQATLSRDIH